MGARLVGGGLLGIMDAIAEHGGEEPAFADYVGDDEGVGAQPMQAIPAPAPAAIGFGPRRPGPNQLQIEDGRVGGGGGLAMPGLPGAAAAAEPGVVEIGRGVEPKAKARPGRRSEAQIAYDEAQRLLGRGFEPFHGRGRRHSEQPYDAGDPRGMSHRGPGS